MYTLLRLSIGDDAHLRMLYLKHSSHSECFFIEFRYYCHPIAVISTTASCKNGDSWIFVKLKKFGITAEHLINWLIPFDVIEQYTAYLDLDENTDGTEAMICNCSHNQIGRKCEYALNSKPSNTTDLLASQMGDIDSNSYEMLTRFVDGIVCICADLFLEWRHICDGLTQCLNGADEVDCHLLEFHKCELDEFQCRNGMCIPIEFAFDAMSDCMDGSDEQELDELHKRYYDCSKKSTYDCDDRLCRKDQFSCGNGECVPWSSVLPSECTHQASTTCKQEYSNNSDVYSENFSRMRSFWVLAIVLVWNVRSESNSRVCTRVLDLVLNRFPRCAFNRALMH